MLRSSVIDAKDDEVPDEIALDFDDAFKAQTNCLKWKCFASTRKKVPFRACYVKRCLIRDLIGIVHRRDNDQVRLGGLQCTAQSSSSESEDIGRTNTPE